MSGTLYGLGIGPGDPELVTLKALRVLQAAPVIAYPAPMEGESLARALAAPHIPEGREEIAIRTPYSTDPAVATPVYDRAAEDLAAHLDAGRDVAVLCEGDPFFYGSFMYLHDRLAERFPTEVVPGVSSLTAAAAVTGRPLVSRNQVLTVIPALLPADEIAARLRQCDGAAILKLGRHFPKVLKVLDDMGLAETSHYVSHATMERQTVSPVRDANPNAAPYFSLILVGGKDR